MRRLSPRDTGCVARYPVPDVEACQGDTLEVSNCRRPVGEVVSDQDHGPDLPSRFLPAPEEIRESLRDLSHRTLPQKGGSVAARAGQDPVLYTTKTALWTPASGHCV
jgi:hypothetical protein